VRETRKEAGTEHDNGVKKINWLMDEAIQPGIKRRARI
jgi:hypothetical protein